MKTPDIQLARRLGAMLKCADREDEFEYKFMFDLTANAFLQKLIPKRIMDHKLNLAAEGLFRSLVVLDFFTGVVAGDDRLIDNLRVIYKTLLKGETKTPIRTGLIVAEIGLLSSESGAVSDAGSIRKRFGGCKKCCCDPNSVDPFYEGMGFMLLSQLTITEAAAEVASKADYKAAVFTDALLAEMPSPGGAIVKLLRSAAFLDAALQALRALSSQITIEDMPRYIT
ncbi:MAG: hypothetical protein AB1714_11960 [Acidobacteriota bacterium]